MLGRTELERILVRANKILRGAIWALLALLFGAVAWIGLLIHWVMALL